ncbi:hypothetical protein KIN20_020116 [Parelaphostrongylus tenuis]|uniref:Uncharacterized protein n=1 Tax=Parelaphostrongylus tenuis TaxID=148309 RepID=A0AAD5MLZ5_PARTN|nr:hypothetical protein KIN20_020116 [Parelaphostrongylus tenuis]
MTSIYSGKPVHEFPSFQKITSSNRRNSDCITNDKLGYRIGSLMRKADNKVAKGDLSDSSPESKMLSTTRPKTCPMSLPAELSWASRWRDSTRECDHLQKIPTTKAEIHSQVDYSWI